MNRRADKPELMDDFTSGGPELLEALRHLRRLNRIFGAAGPSLYGVKMLWRYGGMPESLTILDVGSGSGDVNRSLLRWADTRGIRLSITLVDITAEACAEASRLFRDDTRVTVLQSDVRDLPEACADIVTGSQFLHHFGPDELPSVVSRMLRAARLGVVINDIHRHWLPWSSVWLTTRLVSANRYIRHDGPLSVAKGFRPADWEELRYALGGARVIYRWRPLFRYAVIITR